MKKIDLRSIKIALKTKITIILLFLIAGLSFAQSSATGLLGNSSIRKDFANMANAQRIDDAHAFEIVSIFLVAIVGIITLIVKLVKKQSIKNVFIVFIITILGLFAIIELYIKSLS